MEIGLEITLGIIFFLIISLIIVVLVYLVSYLPKLLVQNSKNNEELTKTYFENFGKQEKENREQQDKLISARFEQIEKGINDGKEQQRLSNENQQKLLKADIEAFKQQQKQISESHEKLLTTHLKSLGSQQKLFSEKQGELLKEQLNSFSQDLKSSGESLNKINTLLLTPFERGKLGNIQLDRLLSYYLPKDDNIYQLEYTLKKKTESGDGLRVDAVVFGIKKKGNLAIDSKFPLENYLASIEEGIVELEKEGRVRKFKENLKIHIKKVAEYISRRDGIEHAIMFIPSEVIFAKINEQSYYEIIEYALTKKVSLCSPVTLAIIINQMSWANETYEQYRKMDKVVNKLQSFWTDFSRFQERWVKILDAVNRTNKTLQDFNFSIEKIVKHGDDIKKIEVAVPQEDIEIQQFAISSHQEKNSEEE